MKLTSIYIFILSILLCNNLYGEEWVCGEGENAYRYIREGNSFRYFYHNIDMGSVPIYFESDEDIILVAVSEHSQTSLSFTWINKKESKWLFKYLEFDDKSYGEKKEYPCLFFIK